jgi:hypothetical protein
MKTANTSTPMNNLPTDAPAPVKKARWRRRLLRAGIVLVTLIVLFYVEENWRGARAWDRVQSSLKARGEPLTMEELLPAVPDERNFFAYPIIQEKFRTQEPNWFSFKDKARLNDGLAAARREGESHNLPAILQWLRVHATWPLPEETGKTGADILAVLAPADAGLAALREATARPDAQLLAWQAAPGEAVNGARFQIETSRLYHLRCMALLHDGHIAEAGAECLQAIRFARRSSGRPLTLMQALIACSVSANAVIMLRDGTGGIPWDAATLQLLEAELSAMDLSGRFGDTLRGERILVLTMVLPWPEGPLKYDGMEVPWVAKFPPSGWRHLWLANICEALQERIDGIGKDGLRAEMGRKRTHGWLPPQPFVIAGDEFLSYDRIIRPVLQYDTTLHIARVSLAVARWRLTKGTLPQTLSELQEYFPSGIPNDALTGQALEYRPAPDGSFTVYPSGGGKTDLYADLAWKVSAPAGP